MEIKVYSNADETAQAAAIFIANEAIATVADRGSFVMAVSGGHTPWLMLRDLSKQKLPWPNIQIVQVDERVAPAGHNDRNLTHLQESLLQNAPLSPKQIHAMNVESENLRSACEQYSQTLQAIAGAPPVIDLIHLGLGPDGHTASLIPGDPVLDVTDRDVAVAGPYQGRQRMTLTYPAINRARLVLWVVTGSEKAGMLARLHAQDTTIPAGRVRAARSVVLADRAAAAELDHSARTNIF